MPQPLFIGWVFISNVWILQQLCSLLNKSLIQNVYYYFELNLSLVLLVKLLFKKSIFEIVFQSSKDEEEITLPHEFIFVFIQYFIGAILLGKAYQKQGIQKKMLKGGYDHTASQYYIDYDFERLKGGGPIHHLNQCTEICEILNIREILSSSRENFSY